MISKLLIKSFVRDHEHTDSPEVRMNYGIFSGCVGLAVNILLAALKFAIGLLTGSVAISADAVNNLLDAGNSVVTVFGFKTGCSRPRIRFLRVSKSWRSEK